MKSFLSLLAALVVVAGLGAGGYYLYQQVSGGNAGGSAGGGAGHVLTATSSEVTLALTNGTHYVLTVTMKQGTELVRFEIAPGHTETRSFPAGTYSVDGKISDPTTDPFSTSWTFQGGGQYNATFSRDQQTGQVGTVLELAGQGQGQNQGQGNQGKPKSQPKSRP